MGLRTDTVEREGSGNTQQAATGFIDSFDLPSSIHARLELAKAPALVQQQLHTALDEKLWGRSIEIQSDYAPVIFLGAVITDFGQNILVVLPTHNDVTITNRILSNNGFQNIVSPFENEKNEAPVLLVSDAWFIQGVNSNKIDLAAYDAIFIIDFPKGVTDRTLRILENCESPVIAMNIARIPPSLNNSELGYMDWAKQTMRLLCRYKVVDTLSEASALRVIETGKLSAYAEFLTQFR